MAARGVLEASRRWVAAIPIAAALVIALAPGCAPKPAVVSPVAPEQLTTATPSAADSASVQPSSGTQAATTTPPVAQASARMYFGRGEVLGVGSLHAVSAAQPLRGALRQLLVGPTATEKAWGFGTSIPTGTVLHSVKVSGDTALIDLSRRFEAGGGSLSMQMRVAEVVWTATQFPSVKRVAFLLDGRRVESIGGEGLIVAPSVERNDFENVLPAILAESPTPGQAMKSPLRLRGSANVFEAQFNARVIDPAGKTVAEKTLRASSGSGTRGTFNASVTFTTAQHGTGWVEFFDYSAKDGSRTDLVRIPVRF